MKFILFKLNSKHHQKLKLKVNRNYLKNKKNIIVEILRCKKIKMIKSEYFIIN